MSKTQEALKLALEALETLMLERGSIYENAITAIREALAEQPAYRAVKTFHEGKPVYVAEQPAQGCEFCSHPLYAGTKCKNCGREQPAHESAYQRGYMDGIAKGLRMEQPAPVAEPHKQQEPVADPFADIRDKRIGEMTAEQQDRAVELWLRNQKGWLPMSQREHVEALLRVIDGLRAPPPASKPLTDADLGVYISKELAEYINGAYADIGCAKDQLIHFARAIEAAHGIK